MRSRRSIFIISLSIILISCSNTKQSVLQKQTLEGTVYSIGPEPFTKIGLQTADGKMYILQCTNEIKMKLDIMQGKQIKIRYNSIEQTPEGQIVKVVNIE